MTMNATPPQNLARHFYDVHRADVASQGGQLPRWYQLPPTVQAEVQADVDKFWTALRNAELGQQEEAQGSSARAAATTVTVKQPAAIRGLLAELGLPAPGSEKEAGQEKREVVRANAEGEDCPGCVFCIFDAVMRMLNPSTERPPARPAVRQVRLVPLDVRRRGVPVTEDEKDQLEKAPRKAGNAELELTIATIDLDVLTGDAPVPPPIADFGTPWITEADLLRAEQEVMRRDREQRRLALWLDASLRRQPPLGIGAQV
ncbi:hypothetical protein ABZV65_30655 [Streptomyces bauhiniae]|uniref:hypothetical protein n=1 Tax=Streptomyces bauhiniae TaxID=2340725 RepID=UPI00339E35F6